MSEKDFYGVCGLTKGGHSKLRGQPLQRHVSAWRRCVQMVHGEDLDRLNGGRGSSVHFVWGHRTQQDRPEQGPANNAIAMQPSYILFAAEQGTSARCRAYRWSYLGMRPIRRAAERRTRYRQLIRVEITTIVKPGS